jgi:hypothetical protein
MKKSTNFSCFGVSFISTSPLISLEPFDLQINTRQGTGCFANALSSAHSVVILPAAPGDRGGRLIRRVVCTTKDTARRSVSSIVSIFACKSFGDRLNDSMGRPALNQATLYIQTHAIIIGRLQIKIRHSFDILLSAVLEVF